MPRSTPQVPIADKVVLTVNDTAAFLGVSRETVYKLLRASKLSSVVIAGRRLITREAIDSLISNASTDAHIAASGRINTALPRLGSADVA